MTPRLDPVAVVAPEITALHLIDWSTAWDNPPEPEWLAEPIIPKGRSVSITANAKSGKSLLLADVCASIATGRPILGRPNPHGPRSVLYLDYEMTRADVLERLGDMGYGPTDDLSRLHYAVMPTIDPLDTEAGGRQILEHALRLTAELVVADTFARAVSGPEDSSDTYRAFFMHTGLLLKQQGIAFVRADHRGHDQSQKRARGSSGKADDVDVAWVADRTDSGLKLTRTHSRVVWVPAEVIIGRHEDDEVLSHRLASGSWPAGTKEVADLLDLLGVDVGAPVRAANDAIRAKEGKGRNTKVVTAAQRYRRERSTVTAFPDLPETRSGNTAGKRDADETADECSDVLEPLPGNTTGNAGKHARPDRETTGFPIGNPRLPTAQPELVERCRRCDRERPWAELTNDAGWCRRCRTEVGPNVEDDW